MKKNRHRLSLLTLGMSAFLALAVSAGGCGSQQDSTAEGSGFTADRLPGIGSVYDYYTAAPVAEGSQGTPVSFSLESSWDFSNGPTDNIQKASVLAPQGLPGAGRYPQANLCLKSELSGDTAYVYYAQDDLTRKLLGTYVVAADGSESWDRYEPPKTVLRFPMSTDQEALEEKCAYTNSNGASVSVTCMLNVRWIDTITVPAGTFEDTVMMQNYEIFEQATGSFRSLYYTWYAPDVGQVAFMRGPNNDIQPAFEYAQEFRRLKSYQLP